jgi:hypothetical protein
MAINRASLVGGGGAAAAFARLTASDGSTVHPHLRIVSSFDSPARDVVDTLHLLCMAHGSFPGLIDHARRRSGTPTTAAWLDHAADVIAGERQYLARLVAAAGPLPSTPGHAESEAAVTAQRHALDMLGQSEREGCAFGAAAALLIDWIAVRRFLDSAARRLGIEHDAFSAIDRDEIAVVIDAAAERAAVERALSFGAQQLLAQQHGLWDLLEARAAARTA